MDGYRGRTFCEGKGCKHFDDCPRALTEAVREKAKEWWGGDGAPISTYKDETKLECYEKED